MAQYFMEKGRDVLMFMMISTHLRNARIGRSPFCCGETPGRGSLSLGYPSYPVLAPYWQTGYVTFQQKPPGRGISYALPNHRNPGNRISQLYVQPI